MLAIASLFLFATPAFKLRPERGEGFPSDLTSALNTGSTERGVLEHCEREFHGAETRFIVFLARFNHDHRKSR